MVLPKRARLQAVVHGSAGDGCASSADVERGHIDAVVSAKSGLWEKRLDDAAR